jgi:hypothetical protein
MPPVKQAPARQKLSYAEAREYGAIEQRIADAERELEAVRAYLEDPAVVRDGARLQQISRQLEEGRQLVDNLYSRWAELEEKQRASEA